MNISLNHIYKSIASFHAEDLPDFAVFIGRNGVGKTQILQALMEGEATVPETDLSEIEFYDAASFRTSNTGNANGQYDQFALNTSRTYLSPGEGNPPVNVAKEILDACVEEMEDVPGGRTRDDFEGEKRRRIQQMPDFGVFGEAHPTDPYDGAIFDQVMRPLLPEEGRRRNNQQPRRDFGNNQAALISAAMKLAAKLPHEVDHADILLAWHYQGNTLSNTISDVFAAYKINQYRWAVERAVKQDGRYSELVAEYRAEHSPPWEALREVLSNMRNMSENDQLFNFCFSDPDDHYIDPLQPGALVFKSEMTNLTTGATYGLNSLSSGEQILMALCLVAFNQYLGRKRPKLLLLDELDTVLHPSMVAPLVETLKTLFVSQGTQVLMTSHSPMTIAALEEADIFRVARASGDVTVARTTKSEAISELSEGIATLDTGLKIAAYDEAKVVILTEGHNTKHLKRWAELHFDPGDVRVFEGLEGHTSKDHLLSYGRMLALMNTDARFLIVWDCDAESTANKLSDELPDKRRVTAFAFARRMGNRIAEKGIENNYNESILEPYKATTARFGGSQVVHAFDGKRKGEFADYILQHGTREDFTHFHELEVIMRGILDGGIATRQGAIPDN